MTQMNNTISVNGIPLKPGKLADVLMSAVLPSTPAANPGPMLGMNSSRQTTKPMDNALGSPNANASPQASVPIMAAMTIQHAGNCSTLALVPTTGGAYPPDSARDGGDNDGPPEE